MADEYRQWKRNERFRSRCIALIGGVWILASVVMFVYWHTPVGTWIGR